MLHRWSDYAPFLIVLPVVLAGWLTFSATPITGLPLSELAMYDAAEASAELGQADLDPAGEQE